MIIITVKFRSKSTKTYDYVFYNDKRYQVNKELPVKIITGSSHGTLSYNLITLISCKKVTKLPPYVTASLTLVGDNIVETGSIRKTSMPIPQVITHPVVMNTTPTIVKPSTWEQQVHQQLLQNIQTEIDHIQFLLHLRYDHVYSKHQLFKQLQILQRRKEKYESEI